MPHKTHFMPARVVVRDGESLQSALLRFRKAVSNAYKRQFYKTRVGCYEKPSDRKRRSKRASERRVRIRTQSGSDFDGTVYMRLKHLHSRGEDPFRT
jgi:ribosomal protein S21